MASIALNIALGFALYRPFGAVGLAAATSIASWVNALALGWLLRKRGDWRADVALVQRAPKSLLASLAMGGVVLAGVELLAGPLAGGDWTRAAALGGICAGSGAFYLILGWSIGAADRDAIAALAKRPLDRVRRRRDKARHSAK